MSAHSEKKEKDILKLLPPPKRPPRLTSRRIGIHTSTAGGVANAAERAYRLGCNAFQIFSSSPRQWAPYELARSQCEEMTRLRERYGLTPLVIHANYLVNLAGGNPEFHAKSISAFRSEIMRALALQAEYLVLHPGSFRGGTCEQVAELIHLLRKVVPCGACIDTCHTHVAGYDIVRNSGYRDTLDQLDCTVGLAHVHVWHCNDAKAACGSHLDRHQNIGKGTIGLAPFRRLLNDPRLAHSAFIAETPIDEP